MKDDRLENGRRLSEKNLFELEACWHQGARPGDHCLCVWFDEELFAATLDCL